MAKRKTDNALSLLSIEVDSTSSSPYESGLIEIEIQESRLKIRFSGCTQWEEIAWHEVLACAGGQSRKLSDELDFLREKALNEGYEDGFKYGSKEHVRMAIESRRKMEIIVPVVKTEERQ